MAKPRKYGDSGNPLELDRLESQAVSMDKLLDQEFQILGLRPNLRVLDAGCGSGAVTRKISRLVYPETVVGMDIDPIFIEQAGKDAVNRGIENIQFDLGNIDSMDYEEESFDLSYCRLVLMHVSDPVRSVKEMRRVTRSGGYVAVSDVEDDLMTAYPDTPISWDVWKKYGEYVARKGMDRHIGRQLYSILTRAGLESVSIHPMPLFATAADREALRSLVSVGSGILLSAKEGMISGGYTSEEEFDSAIEELDQSTEDEGGFRMACSFLAVGKVP